MCIQNSMSLDEMVPVEDHKMSENVETMVGWEDRIF